MPNLLRISGIILILAVCTYHQTLVSSIPQGTSMPEEHDKYIAKILRAKVDDLNSRLIRSAQHDSSGKVAQTDARDSAKEFSLHKAVLGNKTELVEYPIKNGANQPRRPNVNVINSDGLTPLHISTIKGASEMVSDLIAGGARMDIPTEDGLTALHLAAIRGFLKIVSILVAEGAQLDLVTNEGLTALHLAAMKNRTDVMVTLLRKGANANAVTPSGSTVLHLMSAAGNVTAVEAILEHARGLRMEFHNADGLTAFHLATVNRHRNVMESLLRGGADINSRTPDGSTALHLAAAKGDLNAVNLITKSEQALLNAMNNDLLTPLVLARLNGHSFVVLMLTKKITYINVKLRSLNLAGTSSVHDVKALMLRGATDGPDADGWSLLHRAVKEDKYDVLVYLVDHGAPLNSRNAVQYRQTPLYEAAYYGKLRAVKYLVDGGADVNIKGYLDKTPLQAAYDNGHSDVVNYLKSHGGV